VESWNEVYESIRVRFLEELGPRLDEIDRAIDGVRSRPSEAARLHELRKHFHKLAGAAGSYGWPHLSEVSLEAELACAKVLSRGGEVQQGELQHWRDVVGSMRSHLAEVTSSNRSST
jgi:HPt (histidine-containing phosphotransfer) domain-containing protein